jgi:hypothetical protein
MMATKKKEEKAAPEPKEKKEEAPAPATSGKSAPGWKPSPPS